MKKKILQSCSEKHLIGGKFNSYRNAKPVRKNISYVQNYQDDSKEFGKKKNNKNIKICTSNCHTPIKKGPQITKC